MHPSIQRALLILLTACGGSSSRPDAGPDIDAPPDTPPQPGTAITIETDVAPSLIAYRDGAGGWKTAKTIDLDTFELDVHGPYIVTVACDDGAGNITTWQVARTPDDDRDLFLPCSAAFAEPFALTGTMAQAGSVSARFSTDRGTTANWAFDLSADPGALDLVAFDANRITRRALTITADTQVTPPLDVSGGTLLVAAPLTAPNAIAGETISASINITTSKSTFVPLFRGAAAQTKIVPSTFLGAGERQSASVTARQGSGTRALRRATFRAGDPTDFVVPAALGPVTYAQPGKVLDVTWTTLPEHEILDISVDAFSEDFTTFFFHDFEISAAYITATGAKTMTLDTEIPGYKDAWRIDYAKEYFRTIQAIDFRSGETATSAFTEDVNAPPTLTQSSERSERAERLRSRVARQRRP